MGHVWLSGKNANTEHDLLPELRRAREARAKLKHAVLAVSLKKRLADLKTDEADSEDELGELDQTPSTTTVDSSASSLKDKLKAGAGFREVVMASVRDAQNKKEALEADQEMEQEARRRSYQGP